MSKAKTDEQFKEELKRINPYIECITFYVNSETKIKVKDKRCEHEWYALPQTILKGHGCKKCSNKTGAKKRTTSFDSFLKRFQEKCGNHLEYISGYVNMETKCIFRCKVCGYIFKTTPHSILRKNKSTGCPECAKKSRAEKLTMPLEVMIERVKLMTNDTIEYIGGYINTMEKCKWRCKLCNHEWETLPNHLINGSGCPKCKYTNMITPIEVVKEQIKKISEDTIEYVSDYVNIRKKCKWRCKLCGNEWEATPNNVLHGTRCPLCIKESMEKPVKELLDKKNVIFNYDMPLRDCIYDKYPLRPDFLIKTEKGILWIECDGKQHHLPIHGKEHLKAQQKRDRYKDNYCKKHHICLIRVTSSHTKKWGTSKHITLKELFTLIEKGISTKGEINFEIFWKYDFNRD